MIKLNVTAIYLSTNKSSASHKVDDIPPLKNLRVSHQIDFLSFEMKALHTFGFRGEALSSLCAVSEVAVVTRTADQEVR